MDDEEITYVDRGIDSIVEKLRDLVREMDRLWGNESIYHEWLSRVAFQGELAVFLLREMEGDTDES